MRLTRQGLRDIRDWLLLIWIVAAFAFAGVRSYRWYKVEKAERLRPNIIWLGHPVTSDNDRYTPTQSWPTKYEIGLRDDGVVVWRDAED